MSDSEARAAFTAELVEHGHFIPTGVAGVYGRGPDFEQIVRGFEGLVRQISSADGAKQVLFPPVINREVVRRTGYMDNFPDLCGSVHSFCGRERDALALGARVSEGGDWTEFLNQTDVTLTPAGCYPLYPTQTGTVEPGGRLFHLTAWVFRHEPSDDPARMQMFRQLENVRIGSPDEVLTWRDGWRTQGLELIRSVGLDARLEVASDPFFGRGGKLMKATQREQQLKFEVLVPICSEEEPTAVASFNYHQEKFGHIFDIHTSDGREAHTACFGFGLERITLALFKTHGPRVEGWPADVRQRLLR